MISKKLRELSGLFIILIIFFFFGRQLYLDWSNISRYDLSLNYFYFGLSIILLVSDMIFSSFIWWMILRSLGEKLDIKTSAKIWFLSQIGRYIPGKVWQVIGRLEMCKKYGISRKKTLVSTILELALITCAGIIVFLFSLFFLRGNIFLDNNHLILIFVLIPLILSMPIYLKPIINLGLRIVKKEPVEFNLKYKTMFLFLLLNFISWLWSGSGFFFLIFSIYKVSFSIWPQIIGIFAISWVLGFLSFLTPGGIGVKEGVSIFLLKTYMPIGIAIIVSIAARIVITILEIIMIILLSIKGHTK